MFVRPRSLQVFTIHLLINLLNYVDQITCFVLITHCYVSDERTDYVKKKTILTFSADVLQHKKKASKGLLFY